MDEIWSLLQNNLMWRGNGLRIRTNQVCGWVDDYYKWMMGHRGSLYSSPFLVCLKYKMFYKHYISLWAHKAFSWPITQTRQRKNYEMGLRDDLSCLPTYQLVNCHLHQANRDISGSSGPTSCQGRRPHCGILATRLALPRPDTEGQSRC